MYSLLKNTHFNNNTSDKFMYLTGRIEELARSIGITVKAFNDPQLPFYNSLSEEKRQDILFAIKNYVDICETTIANGKELSDTRSFTWFALKEMGMRFNSDIFSYIDETDVIEVYTNDNIQIFRNFRFLELISYTLEDIFCRPWTELFDHKQPEKVSTILSVAKKFLTKELTSTVSLKEYGSYTIKETCSPQQYHYDYTIKYASPIIDKESGPFGYLLIESAEVVPAPSKSTTRDLI